MCNESWGKVISVRLQILETWAHKQGLELAAECHLAKINQCADFLQVCHGSLSPPWKATNIDQQINFQAGKSSVADVQQLACSCFRLNSLQMAALLQQEMIPKNIVDTAIRMAESVADELTRADGREVSLVAAQSSNLPISNDLSIFFQVCLEESPDLPLGLLIPDDGFSSDVVRGIPAGLVDFVSHLQAAGMCRLAAQPTSIGLWTVYMHQYNVNHTFSQTIAAFTNRILISPKIDAFVECAVDKVATARSASN